MKGLPTWCRSTHETTGETGDHSARKEQKMTYSKQVDCVVESETGPAQREWHAERDKRLLFAQTPDEEWRKYTTNHGEQRHNATHPASFGGLGDFGDLADDRTEVANDQANPDGAQKGNYHR